MRKCDCPSAGPPFRSPEVNGDVERNNGPWRYGFHVTGDLHTDDLDRPNGAGGPHHGLDGQAPAEHLAGRGDGNAPNVSHVTNRDADLPFRRNRGIFGTNAGASGRGDGRSRAGSPGRPRLGETLVQDPPKSLRSKSH